MSVFLLLLPRNDQLSVFWLTLPRDDPGFLSASDIRVRVQHGAHQRRPAARNAADEDERQVSIVLRPLTRVVQHIAS